MGGSERGRVMARNSEKVRGSERDRVITRDCKESVRNRVMVRENERDRKRA